MLIGVGTGTEKIDPKLAIVVVLEKVDTGSPNLVLHQDVILVLYQDVMIVDVPDHMIVIIEDVLTDVNFFFLFYVGGVLCF
jgi:hypothetical protein